MHLGILVYALDRPLSGISRYTVELVRHIAGLPDAPRITLFSAGGLGELVSLGLPHVQLSGCRLMPGLMTVGNAQLYYLARRHQLDIFHDMTGLMPTLFGTGHAKKVITLYDVIPLSFPGVSTTIDSLVYGQWLPRMLPRADAILTISDASKRDIAHYMRVPATSVHNIQAGRSPRYQPASAEDIAKVRLEYELPDRYILYVGSVQKRKNLKNVLMAYATLPKETPSLVIVGAKNWRYSEIEATFDTLNLADRVLFTGYVPDEDLPTIYSGADVFVFPSLYEGFGLPVLEAMACGVPTITSNSSSLPEVAGDAALLVDPYNVEEIAEAIHCLAHDPVRRASMRERGFAQAQRFDWHTTATQTFEIYQKLVHS